MSTGFNDSGLADDAPDPVHLQDRLFFAWELVDDFDVSAKDDESAKVGQMNQRLARGERIWTSLSAECPEIDVLDLSKDQGLVSAPLAKVSKVLAAWGQYQSHVAPGVSGLGTSAGDAYRARSVAQARGQKAKGKVLAWNPKMGEELKALAKAEFGAPAGGQGETSDATGLAQQIDEAQENAPQVPEGSHEQTQAAGDPRDMAHALASAMEQSDEAEGDSTAGKWQKLRASVIKALDNFQARSKTLETIKDQDPTAYKSLMAMMQTLLDVASQMSQPVAKSEGPGQEAMGPDLARAHRILFSLRGTGSGEECCARGRCRALTTALYHALGPGKEDWQIHKAIVSPSVDGHWYLHHPASGHVLDPSDTSGHAHDPARDQAVPEPKMTPAAFLALAQIPASVILDRGLGQALGKSASFPVGTQRDAGNSTRSLVGRIKVSHGTGEESWLQARAGKVQAVGDRYAPPIGGQASHAISSRNVSGR